MLVLTLAACGGDKEETVKQTVPATEVCGRLSPKAAKALEQVSETQRFEYRSYGTAKTLKDLLHDPDRRGGSELTECVIEPDVADPDESPSKMTVLFEEVERLPLPQPEDVALARLPVGLRAYGDSGSAELWFACEVPGVGTPIVYARLVYGSRPRDQSPKEANIRVLQDLSRRYALAMGCPNAGGIPGV
ncbi:hypothetical protein OG883_16470 [Streptomyces sp. NBC_01142]|uniref:hypothetical protein n=1 Tax=Streptomyces sp. NBC_01142 TaxID=2975865 RepID=UPI0022554E83|nr:hypothetical protein [Streptomyces sp. NBC_01142]MCX4821463.1 hypothetical protein [Streptomyces sp. NBC_01142]